MSRNYNQTTTEVLKILAKNKNGCKIADLKSACGEKLAQKDFYNYLFRLGQQELIKKNQGVFLITEDGLKLLNRLAPQKDGVWKMIIFDIPEKHKKVRVILRAKLKQLHFKKWQNSIWISPYALDKEIEEELNSLGEKFFVRLIKTTQINHQKDLLSMFE